MRTTPRTGLVTDDTRSPRAAAAIMRLIPYNFSDAMTPRQPVDGSSIRITLRREPLRSSPQERLVLVRRGLALRPRRSHS
jgi:hypothetical protein